MFCNSSHRTKTTPDGHHPSHATCGPRRLFRHFSENVTVTVRITGVGTPPSSVGVYRHCLTAASAASSSSGFERTTQLMLFVEMY